MLFLIGLILFLARNKLWWNISNSYFGVSGIVLMLIPVLILVFNVKGRIDNDEFEED